MDSTFRKSVAVFVVPSWINAADDPDAARRMSTSCRAFSRIRVIRRIKGHEGAKTRKRD
jgi:hypothetical protein